MNSYSQKRQDWAIKVQQHQAIPIYNTIWPGCTIEEVDVIGQKNDFAKRRDFSGLDKIIVLNGNEIHIAQRFRKPREDGSEVDFSFRYMTPGPKGESVKSEYFKLIEAIKNDMWFPNKYVWGLTKNVWFNSGFDRFYVYNLRKILNAILDEQIKDVGKFPNGDGSTGIYFKLEDLMPFVEWEL